MSVRILTGDCLTVLATLPAESVDCVVTSPPYWGLRDYGTATWEGGDPDCDHRSPTMRDDRNEDRPTLSGSVATNREQLLLSHRVPCGKCGAIKVDRQLGLERTLGEHLEAMVKVFAQVRRVMKPEATLWLNYGDCYATSPNGRSAADTKAAGNDDRTFRDKPFSTVGAIYEQRPDSRQAQRRGRSGNLGNGGKNGKQLPTGHIVSGGLLKPKDLCMVPNRLAIALQDDGWWVRSEIIWSKPNPMPESVTDRPSSAHEKVWLLSKSARYFYDAEAVRVPVAESQVGRVRDDVIGGKSWKGRNQHSQGGRYKTDKQRGHGRRHAGFNDRWDAMSKEEQQANGANLRNVWTIATKPFPDAHFATFPPELAERCIKAGCPKGGTVLDPFGGAGTTGLVADRLGRDAILIELNPEYADMARRRVAEDAGMFADVE